MRIGPSPQSSPDRPGLDRLGNEVNQREQELQAHRRQMAPLRVWQTQRQVEATQQQIEGVNQEIMNLPPLDPEHPISDMNDPRVQELMNRREALEQQKQTQAESVGEQWTQLDANTRMAYVMDLLVTRYGYPANGAAGLVGNLNAESGILPQRLEGSQAATPMRTSTFQGQSREFIPAEVMSRSPQQQRGPRLPGVGLAQWTTGSRRRGLFQHQFGGRRMGTDILFNMDAQVDYLVNELQSNYPGVNRVVTNSGVSVNDACDEVVYNFEVPGALLDASGNKRSRTDPQVVQVFNQRRPSAQRALTSFNNIRFVDHPGEGFEFFATSASRWVGCRGRCRHTGQVVTQPDMKQQTDQDEGKQQELIKQRIQHHGGLPCSPDSLPRQTQRGWLCSGRLAGGLCQTRRR